VLDRGNVSGSREELEARAREFAKAIEPGLRGSRPIDAIELVTDADVYPVAVALRMLGKIPNQDVLIAGYDNYWPSCWEREFEPTAPVVTVDKFNRASGARMAQMLLDMTHSRKRRAAELFRIKPRLIVTGEADFGSDLP
jgi:DNA-binding LacI/PurR family transcriptional regulator